MTMKLPVDLLAMIPKGDRENFKSEFKNSWYVRQVLAEYFAKKVEVLIQESESHNMYKLPNLKEAHYDNIGERRGMRTTIKLLKEGIPDGSERQEEA